MSTFTIEADGTIGQDSYKQRLLETRSRKMVAIFILTMGLLTMSAGFSPESARAHHISTEATGCTLFDFGDRYLLNSNVHIQAGGGIDVYWYYSLEAWNGYEFVLISWAYGAWPGLPGSYSRGASIYKSEPDNYYRIAFHVWDGHSTYIKAVGCWRGPI